MQVVDDEQQRSLRGQPCQHGGHGLERAPLLGVRAGPARLAATEHVGEAGHQLGQRRSAGTGQRAHGVRWERGQHRAEGLDERLEEQRALGGVAAADQRAAPRRRGGRDHRLRQRGLADPGLAGQQDDRRPPAARRLPGGGEPGQLGVAPDDHRPVPRPPVRAGRAGCGGRDIGPPAGAVALAGRALLAQDREVCRARLGGRFHPELVAQGVGQLPVDRQRAGRLAQLLVGAQEQPVRGLVEAVVRGGGAGQVRRGVRPARAQRSLGPVVARGAAQHGHLRAYRVDPGGVRFLGQCGAGAEQVQRPLRRGAGQRGRARVEPAGRLVDEPGGVGDVDARRTEPVAPVVAHDDVGAELGAQPADQGRDVAGRTLGRLVAPQRVDEAVGGHHLLAAGGQQREQPARLGAADHVLGRRRARRSPPVSPPVPRPEFWAPAACTRNVPTSRTTTAIGRA